MFEKATFTAILQAITPIAHHSKSFGNTAIVMDEPVFQPDGRSVKVPIITGNTMRHGLREAGAYAFLDAAGLLDDPSLIESALRLLFSGGTIGGAAGSTVSISEYNRMIDLVPSLALLGGCAGNRPHAGRVQVNAALLICRDSMTLIEHDPWVRDWVESSGFEPPLAQASRWLANNTRADPTVSPMLQSLLSAEARTSAQERMLASEAARDANDAVAIAEHKSSQMPYCYEIVPRGSMFTWSVTATFLTDLDRDTFYVMLASFLADMRVGGKRGSGAGTLSPIACSKRLLSRPSMPETVALDRGTIGDRFREHVSARKAEIRDFLATVEA